MKSSAIRLFLVLPLAILLQASRAEASGRVIAWGMNDNGQCAVPFAASSGVSAVAAGFYHSLALKNGAVLAWGLHTDGQCDVPEDASNGVSAIAAGERHSLALKGGRVIAWGNGTGGKCTVPPDASNGVSAIVAGYDYSAALKDGRIIVWGPFGAVPAVFQSNVVAIAGDAYHLLGVRQDGRVIACRYNPQGQCDVPEDASNGVYAVATGMFHSLALNGGRVIAWKFNGQGQCTVPEAASNGVTAIAAGYYHSLALKDGAVLSWTETGTYLQGIVPAAATSNITAISSFAYHNLALSETPFYGLQINCGGKFVDPWFKDQGCTNGIKVRTTASIKRSGAYDPAIYQTCRMGPRLTYSFPQVPDGAYRIRLHFAEPTATRAGERLFKLKVEGATALKKLDVFAQTGGRNRAYRLSFDLSVADGNGLQIQALGLNGCSAILNAIEIMPVY